MYKNQDELRTLENIPSKMSHIHTELFNLQERLNKFGKITSYHRLLNKLVERTQQDYEDMKYLLYLAQQDDDIIEYNPPKQVVAKDLIKDE